GFSRAEHDPNQTSCDRDCRRRADLDRGTTKQLRRRNAVGRRRDENPHDAAEVPQRQPIELAQPHVGPAADDRRGQRPHAGARRSGPRDVAGPAVVDGRRRRALARSCARSGRAPADHLRRRRQMAGARDRGAVRDGASEVGRVRQIGRTLPRCHAVTLTLVTAAALAVVLSARQQTPDGAAIFARDCASCHDGADGSRAPKPDVLRQRSPEAILSALTAGGMRPQGGRLSGAGRRAVAEYLSGRALGGDITGASAGRCASSPPLPDPDASPSWAGWAPSPSNARFQDAKQAGLTAEQVPQLSLKWAFGFPDATSAWSQPTVASGRLFVGSQNGTVYA